MKYKNLLMYHLITIEMLITEVKQEKYIHVPALPNMHGLFLFIIKNVLKAEFILLPFLLTAYYRRGKRRYKKFLS